MTLENDDAVEGETRGEVTTTSFDPDLDDNEAEAPYEVLEDAVPVADVRVDVEVDRARGWVGGRRTATITVTNDGPDDAEEVELLGSYDEALLESESTDACLEDRTVCDLGTLASGEAETFEVGLTLLDDGRTPVRADVSTTTEDPVDSNDTDEVTLRILQPEIRILPGVGRTGQVVLAYGERFPPRTRVRLGWDQGIMVDRGPFRVARDGTLRVPIVLVRRDRLGNRELSARSVEKEFSPVSTEALVVARLLAAPTFLTRG